MGQQLRINGELREYEEDTPVKQLRQDADIPPSDLVVYMDGEKTVPVSDRDTVGDIPEGAAIGPQLDDGAAFG